MRVCNNQEHFKYNGPALPRVRFDYMPSIHRFYHAGLNGHRYWALPNESSYRYAASIVSRNWAPAWFRRSLSRAWSSSWRARSRVMCRARPTDSSV